jgi:hypothetical protein
MMLYEIALQMVEDLKALLIDMKENSEFRPQLSFLVKEEAQQLKNLQNRLSETACKEIANLAAGTKVSWIDHDGAWSGTVVEVHYAKVRRKVRNIGAWNDGAGYEHYITRVGTYKDPALVIEIDPVIPEGVLSEGGTALKLLSQINIDELVMAEMASEKDE